MASTSQWGGFPLTGSTVGVFVWSSNPLCLVVSSDLFFLGCDIYIYTRISSKKAPGFQGILKETEEDCFHLDDGSNRIESGVEMSCNQMKCHWRLNTLVSNARDFCLIL